MKKIFFTALSFLLASGTMAQNNLFEELEKFENEEFKKFQVHYHYIDEVFSFKDRTNNGVYSNSVVYIQRNQFGKPLDIEIQQVHESNSPKEYSTAFRHTTYDHYSEPAYVGSDLNGKYTYLMIDGLLFEVENGSEDMSTFGDRSGYGYVYVPMSLVNSKAEKTEDTEKTEGKSKGLKGLKAKLESKLEGSMGLALPQKLKSIESREDYEKIINTYLKEMKVKQSKSPLTDQDKKEIAAMNDSATSEKNTINKANSDYWNSEEGQRVLGADAKNTVKIYNNTGSTVQIIEEDGKTTNFIPSEGTHKSKCTTKVYYCIGCASSDTNTIGTFIAGGDESYCGKTISLK